MGLEIIKKGQGVWSRSSAYLLGASLILFGAWSLYASINRPNQGILVEDLPLIGTLTAFHVVALVVAGAGLLGLHWYLNKPKSVDLMIETEQEMKKVSWPTLPEVWNATIVVAVVTATLALAMSLFDLALRRLFHLVF